MNFEKLTPSNNIEIGIYEDAIDFAFTENDIRNIAISGAYSAGKSSILSSYKTKHKDKSFIHISLAHFEGINSENTERSELEGKILNQLLHKIDEKNIPLTNFRTKADVNEIDIFFKTVGIISYLIILLYFIYFEKWSGLVNGLHGIDLKWTLLPGIRLFMGIISVILAGQAVSKFLSHQKYRKVIHRLSIYGNEIDLFQDDDASYFDKYLNEVIYLFDNTEVDAIVFEDMDRFNDITIFERLREINELVNSTGSNRSNSPLKFFYLLRDDIFDTKDRTKFFDFIIPVVPVVDGSNSYDVILEIFKGHGELSNLDPQFLKGISLFIDDMRLLKNICNEYIIYNRQLNVTELNNDKMLAMVTYKNIFPRDFSELQLGKGYIYTLFVKKTNFVKVESLKISDRIEWLSNQLSIIENEFLEDEEEVAVVLCNKYFPGDSWYDSEDKINWFKNYGSVKAKEELQERLKKVQLIVERKRNSILNEKKLLEKKLEDLNETNLSDLINDDTQDEIFNITNIDPNGKESDFADVKGNDYYSLLKYLIWNGYLDETYADYMTYFYEGGIKKEDKTFLRSVAEHISREYSYPLRNPLLVADNLRIVDFDQKEVLNYDLFKWIMNHEEKYTAQKERMILLLSKKCNYSFLIGFLDKYPSMLDITAKYISEIWPESFQRLLNANDVDDDFLWKWTLTCMCNASLESINKININGILGEYLAENKKIIIVNEKYREAFINSARLINLQLIDLTNYTEKSWIFETIIEECFYQISIKNISQILKIQFDEREGNLYSHTYSMICKYKQSSIYSHIHKNIEEYMKALINESDKINDSYDDLVSILNNDEITDNNKISYINKNTTPIHNLVDIHSKLLWDVILVSDAVTYSEQNILVYFAEKGLDGSLISYINRFDRKINMSDEGTDDDKQNLLDEIIINSEIKIDKYVQLISTLGFVYSEFDIVDISKDRMDILIGKEIIPMTEATLEFIKENYVDNLSYYLSSNFLKYIKMVEGKTVEEDEVYYILDELLVQHKISEEDALEFLKAISQEIRISGKMYSDLLLEEIICNHLNIDDLHWILDNYFHFSEKIRKAISVACEDVIDDICDSDDNPPYELMKQLLMSERVSADQKDDLLVYIICSCRKQQVRDSLRILYGDTFDKIFEPRTRPRVAVDIQHRRILDALKEEKFIEDYYKEGDSYYRIKKNSSI